jgi:hypothetical protein
VGISWQDNGIKDNITDAIAGHLAAATLHLFVTGPTITNATLIGALTEASFAGYSAVALAGWTAASVALHVASSTANPVVFTLSAGSQSIGGWYVKDAGGNLMLAGNDINDPVTLNTTINTYQVTLTVGDAS